MENTKETEAEINRKEIFEELKLKKMKKYDRQLLYWIALFMLNINALIQAPNFIFQILGTIGVTLTLIFMTYNLIKIVNKDDFK